MAVETVTQAPRRPPALANRIVALLLRSPLHGLISQTLMLLTFTGRKSGKTYSVPVGYMQQENVLTTFTDHAWWKNLQARPAVTVHVRGKKRRGYAEIVHDDEEAIAASLLEFARQRPRAAAAYGIALDANGQPDPASAREAARRFTMIHIRLAPILLS